jgi:hypothetical protein
VTIGSGVTELGNLVFYMCNNIKTASFSGMQEPSCGNNVFTASSLVIHVPDGYTSDQTPVDFCRITISEDLDI